MGQDEPILVLNLNNAVHWTIGDALILHPLFQLKRIDLHDGAFPHADYELGLLLGLVHHDGSGEAGQRDPLEGLYRVVSTILFM